MAAQIRHILIASLLGIWCACATTNYSRGHNALQNRDYDLALTYLKRALAEDKNNAYAVRDIGIATIAKGQIDEGIKYLRLARLKIPRDGLALYHLGLAYERKGEKVLAIKTFRYFRDLTKNTKEKIQIETRLSALTRSYFTDEARKVLAQEKQLDASQVPANTIAVLYFKNIGDSRDLDPLQKGLTELLIADLAKVKRLQVIERAQLQCLLAEMGLAEAGIIHEDKAPRLGKLLKVAKLIQGSFFEYANEEIRIDAAILDTRKKLIRPMGNLRGKIQDIFQLEKVLVFYIIDRLKVKPTQAESDAIMVNATENLQAFLAYCRGLDLEDRDRIDQALKEYKEAVKLDQKFSLAQQAVIRSEALLLSRSDFGKDKNFSATF